VEDLRAQGQELRRQLVHMRRQPEERFLWDSLEKEQQMGKAGQPVQEEEVAEQLGTTEWIPVPSFCHVQPGGKKRRIDDAKKGKQNSAIQYTESGHLCSATQPAVCAQMLCRACERRGQTLMNATGGLVSGTDDLPNAFRAIPVRPSDLWANVVAVRNPDTAVWHFQVVWATLFGLASSVIQFGRWSHFLQAVCRRIGTLMWSMYVDDGLAVDTVLSRGKGQQLAATLFEIIGAPLAQTKRKSMCAVTTFLGMEHSLAQVATRGIITFWVKQELHDKCEALIAEHRASGSMTPAQASKLAGMLCFLAQGIYNRIGMAGMAPLWQRMHSDKEPWILSWSLRASLEFFEVVMAQRPMRTVSINPDKRAPLVVATDAQADADQPSGGFLAEDPETANRIGGWCTIMQGYLETWGFTANMLAEGANPIQCCEAAMVPWVLASMAPGWRGRRIIWYIDNTSALYSVVKGSCKHKAVNRAVAVTHFFMYVFDISIWWEFIDSKANWSDGVSRRGQADEFARAHGFNLTPLPCSIEWWHGSLYNQWHAVQSCGGGQPTLQSSGGAR